MNDTDDHLDSLLSNAVATYIPEPPPALSARVLQSFPRDRRKTWFALTALAIAATVAAIIFSGRIPVASTAAQEARPPMQVSRLLNRTPAVTQPLTHVVPRRSVRHERRLTHEEKLLLAVAQQMPEQFPELVAMPKSKPIEPITIVALREPKPLDQESDPPGESQ